MAWRAKIVSKSRLPSDGRIKLTVGYFDEATPEVFLAGWRFLFPLGTTRLEIIRLIREKGIILKARYEKRISDETEEQSKTSLATARTNTAYSNLAIGDELLI